jgi:hypothetical protein
MKFSQQIYQISIEAVQHRCLESYTLLNQGNFLSIKPRTN